MLSLLMLAGLSLALLDATDAGLSLPECMLDLDRGLSLVDMLEIGSCRRSTDAVHETS